MLRIVAFAKAVTEHVAAGCPGISQKNLQERLVLCQGCEFRRGILCGKCDCIIALKARLPLQECPAGKWPKIEVNQEVGSKP